ncbi:ABC transporter substrate-binding protein [Bradyrhizobium sp. 1]|uniref:ABC transporter substrate-binding protein n=1 Tax=Bradyrhizobium sp. 1 TaxID=241591 RepID=UPI001FFB58EC|nr:ABC transporter substrate-binding protein [Bradyrhizobium sp. 1]MCK1394521.1 ABC transporter substrate-binding protein [Bradyrhizobium sp. 1]
MSWKGTGAAVAALLVVGSTPMRAGENTPVKIGVLGDQSSVYSAAGGRGSVEAAKLAAEDAGLVLGKDVEIVSADFQLKVDIGVAIARKWYDDENVDAIIDVPFSGLALAIADMTKTKKKLALFNAAASSELTGAKCSPYVAQWTYDTYSLGHGPTGGLVDRGDNSWFFLTNDTVFGASLEGDAAAAVKAGGGTVIGSVRTPTGATDFSSFLLQAQTSKAKVIGVVEAGADLATVLKQGEEFGLKAQGQRFAALMATIDAIHGVGLKDSQGIIVAEAFYWDQNVETRVFAKRFYERMKAMPTQVQAGAYSVVNHYLKAIKAAGSKDPDKVMAKMREMPINDFMSHDAKLRADGRVLRDLYLFEVKSPKESKAPWDYYKQIAVIPADRAVRPLDQGGCPLVNQ